MKMKFILFICMPQKVPKICKLLAYLLGGKCNKWVIGKLCENRFVELNVATGE